MAYVELDDALIEVGEATKKEIFQRIKDNQVSFNSDIEALKQSSTVSVYNMTISGGLDYSESQFQSFIPIYEAPVDFGIVGVSFVLLDDSTSGDLEIMLQKSSDDGLNWNNILTTNVAIDGAIDGVTAGTRSGAVNFITDAQLISQGDLVRFNIKTVQVNQAPFHLSIYGETEGVE